MTKVHECETMRSAEAWIEETEGEWSLNINHVASEEDLEENHYLEEVGQTIETVSINVRFCPYCGRGLLCNEDRMVPSFTHHDLSKW
jgi:hypothetical protein